MVWRALGTPFLYQAKWDFALVQCRLCLTGFVCERVWTHKLGRVENDQLMDTANSLFQHDPKCCGWQRSRGFLCRRGSLCGIKGKVLVASKKLVIKKGKVKVHERCVPVQRKSVFQSFFSVCSRSSCHNFWSPKRCGLAAPFNFSNFLGIPGSGFERCGRF